jgi:hypothetical protein
LSVRTPALLSAPLCQLSVPAASTWDHVPGLSHRRAAACCGPCQQAIEDGATLASCLAAAPSGIPEALRRYERLRIPRTSRLQAMSADNKRRFHLPDGPAQRERDARMATGSTDWSLKAMAWVYEHDAAAAGRVPAST